MSRCPVACALGAKTRARRGSMNTDNVGRVTFRTCHFSIKRENFHSVLPKSGTRAQTIQQGFSLCDVALDSCKTVKEYCTRMCRAGSDMRFWFSVDGRNDYFPCESLWESDSQSRIPGEDLVPWGDLTIHGTRDGFKINTVFERKLGDLWMGAIFEA
ncbi:hypothetical protein BDZ94DRAFT_856521 [Collybia nuda]|uniref:Uncharacterized protein n=1 Tax=Collybia nuda TaxID=64659 RepID=A0A9P6CHM8_9AGAR|nr:hypothetical protein BDZ94DRAFT_856521 [Collybia nuda]